MGIYIILSYLLLGGVVEGFESDEVADYLVMRDLCLDKNEPEKEYPTMLRSSKIFTNVKVLDQV